MINTSTIHRNALGEAHQVAETAAAKLIGVAVVLDMRSRRPEPDLTATQQAILLRDLADIERGLATVRQAIAGGAPAEG